MNFILRIGLKKKMMTNKRDNFTILINYRTETNEIHFKTIKQ